MTGAVPVTVLVPIHSIFIVQVYVVFIINDLMYNNYTYYNYYASLVRQFVYIFRMQFRYYNYKIIICMKFV